MRCSEIARKTAETDVFVSLSLDGTGCADIDTGCGFLDHMLTLFARHGLFDLKVTCKGDTYVDFHHTVEDIGITLGRAFSDAMGDKKGIRRYGDTVLPMDESLVLSAVDISGRAYLGFDLPLPTEKVGDFDTELVREFWFAFVRTCACTLHIRKLAGENSHHIIEGAFKSTARSLAEAVSINSRLPDAVPSTQGVL